MSIRIVLWVSGILTLIAVGIPESVGLGLFLLAVPGFILALAPTVFLYTATFAIVRRYAPAFAAVRRFLPITHPRALNLIAAVITLGLGVLAALPMALAGRWALSRAATGDVVPHNRVVIGGDVLLRNDDLPVEYVPGKRQIQCNALCAALLDTPGVGTVTMAHGGDSTSYRLLPKGEAGSNAMAPMRPQEILQYLPEKPVSDDARMAQEKAIIARWDLRLASEVTLSMVPSPARHDLTITMTFTTSRGRDRVSVTQVDVRDREGRVLLRRQRVTAATVFVPLLLEPSNLPYKASWGLARSEVATGHGDIRPITVLFQETTLARPSERGEAVASMRDRLAAALLQPGAPADLALATPWLATIDWVHPTDGDIELLGKLLADVRVIDLPRLFEGVHVNTFRRAAELRGAIVARLVNPATSPQLRNRLDHLLRLLPPGTFAVLTPDESAVLHDQPLRLNAPGLVRRLADQGKACVPELVRILQEDVRAEPSAKRRDMLAAVRQALIRLGPDAAGALPAVIELFDQPSTPLASDQDDMDRWRVAMVRIGRPIEQVPLPPAFTVEQIAQGRSDIMQTVKRIPYRHDAEL
jgi:hypothetical protein